MAVGSPRGDEPAVRPDDRADHRRARPGGGELELVLHPARSCRTPPTARRGGSATAAGAAAATTPTKARRRRPSTATPDGASDATVATTIVTCPERCAGWREHLLPGGADRTTVPIYLTRVGGLQRAAARWGPAAARWSAPQRSPARQVNYQYLQHRPEPERFEVEGLSNQRRLQLRPQAAATSSPTPPPSATAAAAAACSVGALALGGRGGSAQQQASRGGSQTMGASPLADPYGSLSNATDIPTDGLREQRDQRKREQRDFHSLPRQQMLQRRARGTLRALSPL